MTDSRSKWGAVDRYYSKADKPGSQNREAPRRFEELLHNYDPELRDRVERTFKQWNLILRDYLRTEMALRLTVGEDAQAIPVHIVDGLPLPFAGIMERYPDDAWLVLYRPLIENTLRGLTLISEKHEMLSKIPFFVPPPATGAEICHTRDFIDRVTVFTEKVELIQQIGKIDQDILGAYFFRVPMIELYWMVIGLVAATLNVSAEALTVVVLTHELAHAYTHLGRDIDGIRWDTEAFANTDNEVVEGLAQFYTSVLCKKLEPRMPAARQAYEWLLQLQPMAYRVQSNWIENREAGGELVRAAMVQVRSRGQQEYAVFLDALQAQRGNLKGKTARK